MCGSILTLASPRSRAEEVPRHTILTMKDLDRATQKIRIAVAFLGYRMARFRLICSQPASEAAASRRRTVGNRPAGHRERCGAPAWLENRSSKLPWQENR